MSTKQQQWSSLNRKIKQWIKKKKVIDVLLFGSTARGKSRPNDLDLCILFHSNQAKNSIQAVSSLRKLCPSNTQINAMTIEDLLYGKHSLSTTLLEEAVSIKTGKSFTQPLGYKQKTLFLYSLKTFSQSDRVRFHYALQGRNSEGILHSIDGTIIAKGAILLPTSQQDTLAEVFEQWKVKYEIVQLLTK